MGKPSRDKGARGEVALVNWLRANGYPDARRYLAGDGRQPGDVDGIPGLCADVKNCARLDIPGWLRQVRAEAGPNRTPLVVVKPRGVADPGEWWAITTVRDFLDVWEAT